MYRLKLLIISIILVIFGHILTTIAFASPHVLSGNVSDNSSNAISGATIDVVTVSTNTIVATTTTDSSGNYSVNIDEGTYNIKVTPNNNFTPAIALSQTISSDTVLNFRLVPAGSVTLSGHVYDPLGNPLPDQTVILDNTLVTTDATGAYFLQTTSGNHDLTVRNSPSTNDFSKNIPGYYYLIVDGYSLTQSTILDITVPAKKVDIHVQDDANSPLGNAEILARDSGQFNFLNASLPIGGGINTTRISSGYGFIFGSNGPHTDAFGNTTLWLLPDPNNYTLTINPSGSSGYLGTTVSNVSVNSDIQQTITLHQPVTLSGHIYDPLGNPLANQTINLDDSILTTTDASGAYFLQASSGMHNLTIRNTPTANNFSQNVPAYYYLIVDGYTLTQNTVLDITVPAKRVDIHVQDAANNPISNAEVLARDAGQNNFLDASLQIGNDVSTTRISSGYGFIFGTTGPHTDASGNATLWLLPDPNSYTLTVNPPGGSGYFSTTVPNIFVNDNLQQTITLHQPVTLSGHVYDPLGNSLESQRVILDNNIIVITDASGAYSLQASSGTHDLTIRNQPTANDFSQNVPAYYYLIVDGYSLTQNTVLDITIPAKKLNVHVQDDAGNPVSDVEILARDKNQINFVNVSLPIGGGVNTTIISSGYGFIFETTGPRTDASGNTTLWLLPDPNSYTLTVNPPVGSIYSPFTLNNIVVSGDQTEIISLQFVHDRPVTTATLSPTPNGQGEYSSPTTVTLSATAASGFTIANTYYKIDGGSQQTYSQPFTVSGGGSHTISYWSIDNVGVFESPNTKTFTIHVNQPPVINSIANVTLNEGDTYSTSGSFNDPDSTSWTAAVDYGDGSGVQSLTLSGTNFSLSHVYKDNGTYTVTVSVTDNQGAIGTGTAAITVNNVNPNVGSITAPTTPQQVNTPITVSALFTDPGVLDTHIAIWDWEDGTTSTGTITESNGSGSITRTHAYTAAGVYTITLTVTDKDGGIGSSTFQYVVVYDPVAGYVTGGGTITSPIGAYTQDSSLSGKAIFGFVSKYQKGANLPTGNTEFQFKVANFNFHSTSYDWLVIGGAKAQYKGSGMINGTGDYAFMLTAIDGEIHGGGTDKFRLKVLDKTTDNIIYDNQLGSSDTSDPKTMIDSGSIVIHH